MKLLDFVEAVNLAQKNETDRAKLLCYYNYKEANKTAFTMPEISDMLVQCRFSTPNSSRLKNNMIKSKTKIMRVSHGANNVLEFLPLTLQGLDKELSYLWNDTESIESNSELIDEIKFCGKRTYLDRLIKQINHSYAHNCYDASAVLMRRLFEILIIFAYQHHNIDDEIKDSAGNYVMLETLVKRAQNNTKLKISRIKNDFDLIREIGNYSAHGFTYTAGQKDIDDIRLKYRVMLEEMYNKAGLIS